MMKRMRDFVCRRLRGTTRRGSFSSSTAPDAGDSAVATAPVILSSSAIDKMTSPWTYEGERALEHKLTRSLSMEEDDDEIYFDAHGDQGQDVGEEGIGGGGTCGDQDEPEEEEMCRQMPKYGGGSESPGGDACGDAAAVAAFAETEALKNEIVCENFRMSLTEFRDSFIATKGDDKSKDAESAAANAAGRRGEGGCCGSPGDGLGPPLVLGLPGWHEKKGDTEVRTEKWQEVSSLKPNISNATSAPAAAAAASAPPPSSIQCHVRSFGFRTPVSAPIGPPSTLVTKTQHFRYFGDGVGLTVDTETVLHDIMYGDCFKVKDRWIVKPPSPSPRGKGVELLISFEIEWMKGTMWKSKIETRTKSDMIAFFVEYTGMMEQLFRE
mmetsp:Transcript_88390/g.171190  ORF Transcript_88390/g.171190 Transcript_88390/m.171190 type:complete len:381 (-) Transcript_88390:134-1276(-)